MDDNDTAPDGNLRQLFVDLFGSDDDDDTVNAAGEAPVGASLIQTAADIPGLILKKAFLTKQQQDYFTCLIEREGWFTSPAANQAMKFGDLPLWTQELSALTPRELFPPYIAARQPLFDQMIANMYNPGDGITAHIDLARFEDGIGIFSFGGPVVMHLYKDDQHLQVLLEGGDLLMLSGAARYDWKHGIDAVYSEVYEGRPIMRTRRISVTLRKLQANIMLCEPVQSMDADKHQS